MYINTDRRKKFSLLINPDFTWGKEDYIKNLNISVSMTYRPSNALNLSLAPNFSRNINEMQYVATADAGGETKYVVAQIDQTTIRIVARVTLMLTPNLSIQYYGQPFGTSGKYSNFKSIVNASASEYRQRFSAVEASSLSLANSVYTVSDGNGMPYSFSNPDFNIGQFRSNMVVRWEYIPGSTLFLVWTRERNGAFYDSDPGHSHYSFDFDQQGHNVFLMKFTYRFRL